MNKLLKLLIVAVVLMPIANMQAEPDEAAKTVFAHLMAATVSNDYDGFVADCDAAMKEAITKPKLDSVSRQMAPRAKAGYDSEYLGELNQRGFEVHLWRLRFKDGGDDILATLSLKDGKAGGFYLR